MNTVLVAGGTGTAGGAAVAELSARGHTVRVLARRVPPDLPVGAVHCPGDLLTGAGLTAAVRGVDVLVSAVNGQSRATRPVFTDGARALAVAARRAGVRRAVVLSIVGVDGLAFSYYAAIAEQERIWAASGVPTTIVRSTQFHPLLRSLFATGARFGVLPAVRGARFQPIAPAEVGRTLADSALAGDAPDRMEIGGPEVVSMRDLAADFTRVTGARAVVLGLPAPGAPGRFLREGRNLTPDNRCGTVTFEQWLAANPV